MVYETFAVLVSVECGDILNSDRVFGVYLPEIRFMIRALSVFQV